MKTLVKNSFLLLLLVGQLFVSCRQAPKSENQATESYKTPESNTKVSNDGFSKNDKNRQANNTDNQAVKDNKVPAKVYEVLKYVKENNVAPDGYVGGRKFGNYENLLPKKDDNGRRINYQEWDVNPKQEGRNRGVERLITGSDGKAYFTKNHYKSFIEIGEK